MWMRDVSDNRHATKEIPDPLQLLSEAYPRHTMINCLGALRTRGGWGANRCEVKRKWVWTGHILRK